MSVVWDIHSVYVGDKLPEIHLDDYLLEVIHLDVFVLGRHPYECMYICLDVNCMGMHAQSQLCWPWLMVGRG